MARVSGYQWVEKVPWKSPTAAKSETMLDGEEIVTERTGGGARAPQVRCFRRIDTETAGVSRWDPISAAEFQQEEPEKSALEKCAEKMEGEVTFAGVRLPDYPK